MKDLPLGRIAAYLLPTFALSWGFHVLVAARGWVLAHDTTAPPFADELQAYLAHVRGGKSFSISISFDVDPCGLKLSTE